MLILPISLLVGVLLLARRLAVAISTGQEGSDVAWQHQHHDWPQKQGEIQDWQAQPTWNSLHGSSQHHDLPSYNSPRGPFDWTGQSSAGPRLASWEEMPSPSTRLLPAEESLSPEDLEFLDGVIVNPEPSQQLAQARSKQGAGATFSTKRLKKETRKRKAPSVSRSPLTTSSEDWQHKHAEKMFRNRAKKKWPEPKALQTLAYLRPIKEETGKTGRLFYTDVESGRETGRWISEHFFDHKSTWVNRDELPNLSDWYYNRWPVTQYSRRLPGTPPGWGDRQLSLHFTEHGFGHSRNLLESKLHGKVYYMFYLVPQELEQTGNPIVALGAGYIEPKDNEAVDKHLGPLLREAERAGRLHV